MSRRRPTIPPRKPMLLGCEGRSEVGYGQLLSDLLRERNLPFHLDVTPLTPGTGDPLSRVQRAIALIAQRRRSRSPYRDLFVLMDDDQTAINPNRSTMAIQLANSNGIKIIWQTPCHEAFLLRHLPGFEQRRPPTTAAANQALMRAWSGYSKPMSRNSLSARIGIAEVERAARVEPMLATLLTRIQLIP